MILLIMVGSQKERSRGDRNPSGAIEALADIPGSSGSGLVPLSRCITPEMIQLISNNKKLVKYFDMPLQHVNDAVLKSMNRK